MCPCCISSAVMQGDGLAFAMAAGQLSGYWQHTRAGHEGQWDHVTQHREFRGGRARLRHRSRSHSGSKPHMHVRVSAAMVCHMSNDWHHQHVFYACTLATMHDAGRAGRGFGFKHCDAPCKPCVPYATHLWGRPCPSSLSEHAAIGRCGVLHSQATQTTTDLFHNACHIQEPRLPSATGTSDALVRSGPLYLAFLVA